MRREEEEEMRRGEEKVEEEGKTVTLYGAQPKHTL